MQSSEILLWSFDYVNRVYFPLSNPSISPSDFFCCSAPQEQSSDSYSSAFYLNVSFVLILKQLATPE